MPGCLATLLSSAAKCGKVWQSTARTAALRSASPARRTPARASAFRCTREQHSRSAAFMALRWADSIRSEWSSAGPAIDVFAFAVIMWELLMQPAWWDDPVLQYRHRSTGDDSCQRPKAFVWHLLAYQPSRRYLCSCLCILLHSYAAGSFWREEKTAAAIPPYCCRYSTEGVGSPTAHTWCCAMMARGSWQAEAVD